MKYIYGLIDPQDRLIRYVGQTNNLERRHMQHSLTNENTPKGEWVRKWRDRGQTIDIVCLEVVADGADVDLCEKWWITLINDHFSDLTNSKNPSKKKVNFGDMFSERLRQEYDTFVAALKSQEPVVMITRAQFAVFVLLLKLFFVFIISAFAGYAIWKIEYSTSYSEIMSLYQGLVVMIACLVMGTLAAYGMARQHKAEIAYVSLVLFFSLYATFGG